MLFNLFLVDVINKVHNLRLGIPLGQDVITVISYADDIIAFVKDIEDLKIVLECIYAECDKINMKVSVTKSKILRIGNSVRTFDEEDDELFDFDQVLKCQYLGVILENKPGVYFSNFATNCVKKCRMYKFSIMRKAKDSHDPQSVARELWNKAALPSILYGSEVLPIRKQELRKLDSEAASMGKFILQLPANTTNVTVPLIGGIETMEYNYYKRVIGYQTRINKLDENYIARRVYNYVMTSDRNFSYKKSIANMQRVLKNDCLDVWYIKHINSIKMQHVSSCQLLPMKTHAYDQNRLRLNAYDESSKIYAEFMTMNAGLGNRGPVIGFKQHKVCQLCAKKNMKIKLNEIHLLFGCDQLRVMYRKYGIAKFKREHPNKDERELYTLFWDSNMPEEQLLEHVNTADSLRYIYTNAMKTILRQ